MNLNQVVVLNSDYFDDHLMKIVGISDTDDGVKCYTEYRLSLLSGSPVGIFKASEIRLPTQTELTVGHRQNGETHE